jgi:hypothetical protein
MNISIDKEVKVTYSLETAEFVSIKFDNGLNLNLSKDQMNSIIEGINRSREVNQLVALINQA